MSRNLFVFLLIISYLSLTSAVMFKGLIDVISDVKNFYKASSIFFIHGKNGEDWSYQKLMVENIRGFSKNHVMSQMIAYENFQFTMHEYIVSQRTLAMEPLFALSLPDIKGLQDFQKMIKNWDMSLYMWFVFMHNETKVDCKNPGENIFDLKMDSRMLVMCENDFSILKYFSIFENSTEVVDLAIWTPDKGLNFKTDDNVLHLKRDMKGITLRLALQRHSPYDRNRNISRFLEAIIELLKKISNFRTKVVIEHNILGYMNYTTNSWSGMMKTMAKKEADIAMVMMSVSNHRRRAVDFSMPLLRARCKLFTKIPDAATIRWSAYFRVFNINAWITIGSLILVLSALLGMTKSVIEKPRIDINLYLDNFIKVWGIYCQQGLSEVPVNRPTQILYFSILISSLVLYAIYSATITSYIAVLTADLPFSSYEEFLKNKEYKVIVLQGSRDELLIHTGDWLLSPLKNRLRDRHTCPTNPYEGFSQLCRDDAKLAFYSHEFFYEAVEKKNLCPIGSLRMPRIENQAIALMKNSPYTETINYFIMKLADHGIIQRLKNKYFYKDTIVFDSPPNVMTLWEVMPILAIWAAGVIVSFFIFWIEILSRSQIFFRKHSIALFTRTKNEYEMYREFIQ